MKNYSHLEVIKTSKEKSIFKVEREEIIHTPFIERILPLSYEKLYRELSHLDTQIPKIEEIEVEEDQLIVIEEYIDKPLLSDYMKTHELSLLEIKMIMSQLCDILHVLHNVTPPIIHRDIKPENIFYDGKTVILGDFDIARHLSEASKDTQVLGSIGYASPEQFGLNQTTTLSDIYSLGVLLNVLLTGELPSVKVVEGPLRKVVIKATATIQSQRYKDVIEMKEAINKTDFPPLPGFRSKKKVNMIIGTIVYLSILYCSFTMTDTQRKIQFGLRFWTLFMFMFTIAMIFNYNNLHSHIPFMKGSKIKKLFIGLLFYLIILFTSAMLLMMIEEVIKTFVC
ncbi:hypothetical protein IV49_GL001993 [Kandleria vitulina DSM 20405]|uniref:non-specific serine/threonine protein kinase n=1 Tax=Kandleria vitulina DSM 20405 TaxID=1410657 RepID=A0A0R2HBS6_9FIRM|nr:protein kinase [Kandleria vitulina]KRN50499.1 hypothetical protein IV49_GL001993 [Kandleria vitulina DSM 20405]MEE0989562.1 protein kinase [Kandleria vitulina]